jgi:DNA-binding MarR family transcriptional regulator
MGKRELDGSDGTVSREAMAERLIAARERLARWAARDFKRRQTPLKLTQTQFAILQKVDHAEGLNMSALAEALDLSVPTIVRAVDALERKALVTRQRSSRDHREVCILVTPEGLRAHEETRRLRHERLVPILTCLSDREVEGLVNGYEALVRALPDSDTAYTQAS